MPSLNLWGWFPSMTLGWIFAATVVAWWVTERLYLPRGTDTRRQMRDYRSRLLNLIAIYFSIGICFVARWLGWGDVDVIVQSLGVALMVAGLLFRAWAIQILGSQFSVHVALQPEHRLVTNGPYRWLRHPSYTGTLLTLSGLPVALGVWPLAAVVSVIFMAAHVFRIHVEEAAMAEMFGETYAAYCKRTWRMFPGW